MTGMDFIFSTANKGDVVTVDKFDGSTVTFKINECFAPGGQVRLEVSYWKGSGPEVIDYADWHNHFDAVTAMKG